VTGRLWAAMNQAGMPFLQFQGRGLPWEGIPEGPGADFCKGMRDVLAPRSPRRAPDRCANGATQWLGTARPGPLSKAGSSPCPRGGGVGGSPEITPS